MKAKELMIGDFVKFDLGTIYKVKVKGISTRDGGEVLVSTGADDMWYEQTFIEPIHLTPEILENNGFIIDSDGWYVWTDGIHNPYQHYISISFRHNKSIHHIEIRANKVHTNYENLQNVHELQNALRLCGLNNLADTFKI